MVAEKLKLLQSGKRLIVREPVAVEGGDRSIEKTFNTSQRGEALEYVVSWVQYHQQIEQGD